MSHDHVPVAMQAFLSVSQRTGWSMSNTIECDDPWLSLRNASRREGRASGAADWHHTGGFERQPTAPLLPRLPWCGCLPAAGGRGADGHRHVGHAVQFPSQVGVFFHLYQGGYVSPASVCLSAGAQQNTKHWTNFLKTWMEAWSRLRIDPINFWCWSGWRE